MSKPFGKYDVRPIHFILADALIRRFHYLHRTPKGVKACFGLFNEDDKLCGVMMFGHPSSARAGNPAFGKEKVKLIELKRLWVSDEVPGNGETFFMGAAIRQLKGFEAVVSYADPEYHTGRLYMAANFQYIGVGGKNVEIKLFDKVYHTGVLKNVKLSELREMFPEDIQVETKPGKLRYFMVIAKGNQRRKQLEALLSVAVEATKGQ